MEAIRPLNDGSSFRPKQIPAASSRAGQAISTDPGWLATHVSRRLAVFSTPCHIYLPATDRLESVRLIWIGDSVFDEVMVESNFADDRALLNRFIQVLQTVNVFGSIPRMHAESR
jgi:hypothetical protein